MIHAGSFSTGSTIQWQAPRRGDTKMLVDFWTTAISGHVESGSRTPAPWQTCRGKSANKFSPTERVHVALKRAAKSSKVKTGAPK